MEKYLFGSIVVLLFFIVGIGVYSAIQHPQETATIPSAAVGAVGEAVEDIATSITGSTNSATTPTSVSETTQTTRESDEDENEDDDDDDRVQTKQTQTTQTQTTQTTQTAGTYTMAQVKTHNSSTSCYSAINGSVYDLTQWIGNHPGGAGAILSLCGKDGTQAFEQKHGGERRPESELASLKIGTLAQ